MTKILFPLIAIFFSTLLHGQDRPKTLLWKVTKEGNKNESYLFGTFHEVSPAFFDSLNNSVKKLNLSKILFVEEELAIAKQPAEPNNAEWNYEKWKTLLSIENEKIFKEFVEKIANETCYIQSPMELLIGISRNYMQTFCVIDSGFVELMDTHIEKLAIKENIDVQSLDNIQGALINNFSNRFSVHHDSLTAVNCILGMQKTLDADSTGCYILNNYKTLDIDYELDTDLIDNEVNIAIIIERNNNWTLTLDKAFSLDNCFVAVGFRHLLFKQGLIQQLRKKGYEVTPIPARL